MIIQSVCINGPIGLLIELTVEANYPSGETVTSSIVQITFGIFPALFIIVFFIPNVGK